MHKFVAECFETILLGACSQISLLVEVASQQPIYASHHPESSYVELPSVDEKGLLYVLLDDQGVLAISRASLVHSLLDVFEGLNNLDSNTSVGILSRLQNPNRTWKLAEALN